MSPLNTNPSLSFLSPCRPPSTFCLYESDSFRDILCLDLLQYLSFCVWFLSWASCPPGSSLLSYVRCPFSLWLNPILLHIYRNVYYILVIHSSAVGVIGLLGSSIETLLGSSTGIKGPLWQEMWIVGRLCICEAGSICIFHSILLWPNITLKNNIFLKRERSVIC